MLAHWGVIQLQACFQNSDLFDLMPSAHLAFWRLVNIVHSPCGACAQFSRLWQGCSSVAVEVAFVHVGDRPTGPGGRDWLLEGV